MRRRPKHVYGALIELKQQPALLTACAQTQADIFATGLRRAEVLAEGHAVALRRKQAEPQRKTADAGLIQPFIRNGNAHVRMAAAKGAQLPQIRPAFDRRGILLGAEGERRGFGGQRTRWAGPAAGRSARRPRHGFEGVSWENPSFLLVYQSMLGTSGMGVSRGVTPT